MTEPVPDTRTSLRRVAFRLFGRLAPYSAVGDADYPVKTGPVHMMWMLEEVIRHVEPGADQWPVDKLSRWIGFVQGVMAVRGWLIVDEEMATVREEMAR